MSKELECLDRIDKRNYLTEREHKEFLGVVEKVITKFDKIKTIMDTWNTSGIMSDEEALSQIDEVVEE